MKAPVEDDLLDSQPFDDNPNSLNRERQKLGYWVRFVCSIALLIAGFGIMLFSYLFIEELFGYRHSSNKGIWLLGGGFWLMAIVTSMIYVKKGSIYGKLSLFFLTMLGGGVVWMYWDIDKVDLDRFRYVRTNEFVLLVGLYVTGLLAFPAAFFGWRYAQALRIPQVGEEDWEWKTTTAQTGLKAWRLGALAFITLGFAWTPLIWDELEYYKRKYDYTPIYEPWDAEVIEEAVEFPMEETFVPDEEDLSNENLEIEDNAPEVE